MRAPPTDPFLERLREAVRKAGGIENVTRNTGIKRSTLGDYLSGKTEPRKSQLVAIAGAASVSVTWLITGQEPEEERRYVSPGSMPPSDEGWELLDAAKVALDKAVAIIGWEPPPNLRKAILTVAWSCNLSLGHLTLLVDAARRDFQERKNG